MNKKIKIIIQDALTINNASGIFKKLSEGLLSDGDLIISIPEPDPVDVTFMQIMHSFIKKYKATDKKVSFEISRPNELVMAFKRMGYYDLAGILESAENKVEG